MRSAGGFLGSVCWNRGGGNGENSLSMRFWLLRVGSCCRCVRYRLCGLTNWCRSVGRVMRQKRRFERRQSERGHEAGTARSLRVKGTLACCRRRLRRTNRDRSTCFRFCLSAQPTATKGQLHLCTLPRYSTYARTYSTCMEIFTVLCTHLAYDCQVR